MKKVILLVVIFCCAIRNGICSEKNFLDVYNNKYTIHTTNINTKLLKTDTLIMFGGSIAGAGILYLLPESITNWDKDDASNIFKKWEKNVREGPVKDKDDWFLNWITHPYWGAVYYMAARSSGLGVLYSFGFSCFLSTVFWEYGIEAFAEVPSKQDLIITPVVGSIFGELFYLSKRKILNNDYKLFNSTKLGHVALFLMDPITEISSLFIKDKSLIEEQKVAIHSFPMVDNDGNLGYNIALNIKF